MPKKQAEPAYKMKGIDLILGNDSPDSVGEMIQLADIILPDYQPRRYFDVEQIEKLALSIKENGVLQPVLVRSKGNKYELIAGERRYRASKQAGLSEIPAIIKKLTDVEAAELALLENLQREDLNPVEETEGILEFLSIKIDEPKQTITAFLHRAKHQGRQSAEEVINNPKWQIIVDVLKSMGYTPDSFRSNRLPLLNLPADVLDQLRRGKIEYTKARVISRVKDDKARQKILKESIDENLSLTQIKNRVNALKGEKKQEQITSLLKRMESVYKKAKKEDLWQEPKKQERLKEILNELEQLLSEK